MYALVVYESMFGNTAAVARAVAEGLATDFDVVLQEVASATAVVDNDVSLLVVGAPTHVFGMSRPNTRQAAQEQGGNGGSVGLREWLEQLQVRHEGLQVAAFDTRVARAGALKPKAPGSAARGAVKRLRGRAASSVVEPTSFFVTDTPGLVAGAEQRAGVWGRTVAALASGAATTTASGGPQPR